MHKEISGYNNIKSLKEVIEEQTILKTQLKLMHIFYLDQYLIRLNETGYSLSDISLEDIYLTQEHQLYYSHKDKIIKGELSNEIKLKSYLLYLSYLYNIDFLQIYKINSNYLFEIILSLNISENIKQNIYLLLNNIPSPYFSEDIEDLNNHEYRESLPIDKKRLIKELKQM